MEIQLRKTHTIYNFYSTYLERKEKEKNDDQYPFLCGKSSQTFTLLGHVTTQVISFTALKPMKNYQTLKVTEKHTHLRGNNKR